MKNKGLILLFIGLLTCFDGFAQQDAYLRKMTEGLLLLRKSKGSNDALNKIILEWSASGKPKITLMDEIKKDPNNEYKGNGAFKFKLNQVVTHVYSRQNTGMVTKGDYFNSSEKDICYSAIEKTVKKNSTVTYTLTGHVGVQEFVFMSYEPNSKFFVKVNGKQAMPVSNQKGVLTLILPKVKKEDKIIFSITNSSASNESYVILNNNPQK